MWESRMCKYSTFVNATLKISCISQFFKQATVTNVTQSRTYIQLSQSLQARPIFIEWAQKERV
jgi:hypothetical protein